MVIGVVAFFVSQPKRGSVEWHKREYLAARNGTLYDRVGYFCYRVTGIILPDWPWGGRQVQRMEDQMRTNKWALIDLEYLGEYVIPLTHRASDEVIAVLPKPTAKQAPFTQIRPEKKDEIFISAPRQDMPKWRELIRQADVPENAK